MRAISSAWNRFFFEPVSPLPIALYRMVFGATVLIDALLLAGDVPSLFGERGMLGLDTAAIVTQGLRVNLIRLLPPGDTWLGVFFAIYLAAAICLTVGLWTRVSAVVVWLGIVSLHHRNGLILNSCDNFLRISAFWMMFSAAGSALSFDSRGKPQVEAVEPWAQRMIQLQISVAYLTTVWLKLEGSEWLDGTAIYWVSRITEFIRFPVPYLFEHLWTVRLLTWGTLAVELSLALLIWIKELRPWVLLVGILFHLGIEWSMVLPLMEWVMIGAYAVFLEEAEILRGLKALRAVAHRLGLARSAVAAVD